MQWNFQLKDINNLQFWNCLLYFLYPAGKNVFNIFYSPYIIKLKTKTKISGFGVKNIFTYTFLLNIVLFPCSILRIT